MTVQDSELDFESEFELVYGQGQGSQHGNRSVDALVVYFDVSFGKKYASVPIEMSTSPNSTRTHWKQTLLFLEEPLVLKPGQTIRGSIEARRPRSARRHYEISLHIGDSDRDSKTSVYALA